MRANTRYINSTRGTASFSSSSEIVTIVIVIKGRQKSETAPRGIVAVQRECEVIAVIIVLEGRKLKNC